ncbi:MAG: hypothetical protein A3J00_00975 [Candidatus Niyogibacteria bacterium RIFCSPLOWO2_02_FULL_45_13]|uniref:Uncharacterized protein n=1 Tax=Candidatus Niyogibacteria bacterium RIFCSPLOWO2_02_FULL_45_13 TaxID=1801725 RepID=A0A1G2EXV5_9BACT|nr:MAG: hypothetical protein A3J00_00975 [Candidatus Niyogibacteria bacterium RIFCSPLOWO2_02_FULL_45_13]
MDEESKKLLLENIEISKKTLEEVRKIERRLFWQRIFKIARWAVIIAFVAVGLWQIQPYIDILLASYQNIGNTVGNFQEIIKGLPK